MKKAQQIKKTILRAVVLVIALAMVFGIILEGAWSVFAAESDTITVSSFTTGKLWDAIEEAKGKTDMNNIKRLAITSGTLNTEDFNAILKLSNIEYLELARAQVSKGIIPDNALSQRNGLTYVSLPQNTATIGKSAFANCKKLKKVDMAQTVEVIDSSAFESCESLEQIELPPSVSTIGEAAFRNCLKLPSVMIPQKVTSIEKDTFSKCYALTEITIPQGVASIKSGAFSECNSLTDMWFASSLAPMTEDNSLPRNVTVHAPVNALEYDLPGDGVKVLYDYQVNSFQGNSDKPVETTVTTTTAAADTTASVQPDDTTAEIVNDVTSADDSTSRTEASTEASQTSAPSDSTAAASDVSAVPAQADSSVGFTWWQIGIIAVVCVICGVAASQILNRVFKKLDEKNK